MAKIIEKHDNDKNYIFTCPVCGTVFTERERNIDKRTYNYRIDISEEKRCVDSYVTRCPNCEVRSEYRELKEHHEPPK